MKHRKRKKLENDLKLKKFLKQEIEREANWLIKRAEQVQLPKEAYEERHL